MKFLNVTVPCSFTSESNECITEATGWSQCRAVHLHPSVFPPLHAGQAPTFDTIRKTWDAPTWRWTVWLWHPQSKICIILVLEISFCKGGQCLFTSLPARVTSSLRHLKRIKHDVIASKSAFRGDYLYQNGNCTK